MELIVREIIATDKEIERLRNEMEQELISKKKELDDYIKTLEKDYHAEIEKMKRTLVNEKISEAKKAAEDIRINGKLELEKLNTLYRMHKKSIVDETFEYLISS